MELQPDLKFTTPNGAVDGDVWRQWKRDRRVSSATYNILLHLPGNQYFAKRLTNKGKLKHASEFQEKFPDVFLFLCNFLRLKSNLAPSAGFIQLRAQDRVSLVLSRDWNYDDQPQLVLQLWTYGWLQQIQTETTVRGIQHSSATSKGCKECQCRISLRQVFGCGSTNLKFELASQQTS